MIFDIDAIGGLSIKKEFPKSTLAVFICPPSLKELENRLRKRGTDSEEKIKIRLSKASKEMSMSVLYDYAIEYHNLEDEKGDPSVKKILRNQSGFDRRGTIVGTSTDLFEMIGGMSDSIASVIDGILGIDTDCRHVNPESSGAGFGSYNMTRHLKEFCQLAQ